MRLVGVDGVEVCIVGYRIIKIEKVVLSFQCNVKCL